MRHWGAVIEKSSLGYVNLVTIFKKKIESGAWGIGQAIPSEASLAKEYGVAVGTIRQAIAELVSDSILVKRHGKSTTVSGGLNGQSMLRFFRGNVSGSNQAIPTATVLSAKEVLVDNALSELTAWTTKSAFKLHRIRFIDGISVLFETIYIPLPKFKKLLKISPQDYESLLYPMYASLCDVAVIKAKDTVSFELLKKSDAKALNLREGHPGVRVDRLAFDISGMVVEFRTSVGDAMAFQYSAEVN
ncbi:GntR family transcriptional regulator [Polynucleobacter sphagniphilus]|jgi:GntR family transcriptional regulator|uniref:GntR family transcriptional regulator n=1 Tax=Polynucleobacter sphagniphilus TaxID=1743169 RepID=UPI002405B5DC|nr:GntR family transcriptional regulator [Polynucleobacter sphagniphilus]MDF9789004.1 GntR family transcriptional regulator [Polynucleobacter sphagniphilus]MDH6154504.1 GntR family transcriptional regulator [Polynucleobacter sphagniphilus]MDH6241521.1 GntR family transcriptional regulator [Polynucleobacter sphagniphilus]MDH6249372.1 GntR family transcriptional regulator [Polynucleobacter sphagniphilus]MDH6300676.1 GntR family transcriptional regulator [Polynucleobacter sphagniphilus]